MNQDANSDDQTGRGRPPRGDASREAVAALRGYAFQIYESTLAWTRLGEDERLYLEVAEDYATVTEDALRAVQARDTRGSGSVTLNTEGVRQAIETLIDLADRNPERTVHLHYLSTSPIGREAKQVDQVEGDAGLAYWARVAGGVADVGPLARRLRAMAFSPRARAFIAACDDEGLRRRLIDRIHWDCGQGGIDDTRLEIEARVTRVGGIHGEHVSLDDAERAIGLLVEHVLLAATRPGSRLLTVQELRRTLHRATHVSVGRSDLSNLIAAAFGSGAAPSGASFSPAAPPPSLDRVDVLPFPKRLLERSGLVRAVEGMLAHHGVAVLCGGTGTGKSLLARLAARTVGGTWHSADLQAGAAPLASDRLRTVLGTIGGSDVRGLLLDDLDAWEEPGVGRALSALLAALRRNGRPCLVITHRDPPAGVLEALGGGREVVVRVSHLDQEETGDLVRLAGGRPATWRRIVWLASDGGHPQLAQAVVTDLAARAWSEDAMSEYLGSGTPPELRREMASARRRLVSAVPDDGVRVFLYRASLILGRFDRSLAMALGAVAPSTARPGEALDQLVGPWIDEVGPDQFRVSPLVGDSGAANLSLDEQRRVHGAVVDAIMDGGSINVAYADALLFHALRGEVDGALVTISFGILRAKPKERRMLAEWSTVLRSLQTTTPAYPRVPSVSLMLRLAQFEVLVVKGSDEGLGDCARALLDELAALPAEAGRGPIEVVVLAQILMERRFGMVIPGEWPDLLGRLGEIIGDHATPAQVREAFGATGHDFTLLGMAFAIQCSAAGGVADLARVFDLVAAMPSGRRASTLRAADGVSGGLGHVVKRPIVEEHDRGTLDWRAAATAYLRMSRQATAWEHRELALHCVAASAMVTDESGGAPDEALATLDRTETLVGPDPILRRARAKVLWRRGDHGAALPLLLRCMGDLRDEGVVEMAFLAREAAMSAATLGDHARARDCFDEGRRWADRASDALVSMSVGLAADAAVAETWLGRGRRGVQRFAECLERLANLDPLGDAKIAYAHRVVGHSILWAYGHLTGTPVPLSDGLARMPPGACSNQEPSNDVDEGRGPSPDLPWYFLALIDVECDLDAGVDAGLTSRLRGRIVPGVEVMLRQARMTRAVRRGDSSDFVRELRPWVDAHVFRLGRHGAAAAPATWAAADVTLPHADAEGQDGPEVCKAAHAALTAFAIVAATVGEPGVLGDLMARLDRTVPEADAIRDRLARMAPRMSISGGIVGDVTDVVATLGRNAPRDPRDSMVASIRLLEAAGGISAFGFGGVVGSALAKWTCAEWSTVATRQSYALVNPRTTVPAITEAVNASMGDLASAARIVLAALPAVRIALDERLRAVMSELASPG